MARYRSTPMATIENMEQLMQKIDSAFSSLQLMAAGKITVSSIEVLRFYWFYFYFKVLLVLRFYFYLNIQLRFYFILTNCTGSSLIVL